ncbi:MAG: radical SAM protein [Bacteroidales bacterium]|jgi:radical SAM protein with 4Fe4S-binding SPASM domain|nr:radical SAM protein [Bacteroidales bacterium]
MITKFNTLYLETTRNCNLACKYCSTGSNKRNDYKDLPKGIIINRILEPAYDLGTRLVNFSGGEFLLRKDAFELISYGINKGFNLALASNGILLNDEVLKIIKEIAGNRIIISLGINSFDDLNAETRNQEFNKTLEILERIEKYSLRANISVTIGKFNYKSFSKTLKEIENLKLPFNRIPFVPRSCNLCKDLMFDKQTLKDYFHPELIKYFNGQVSYTPYFLPTDVYEKFSGQDLEKDQIPINPPVGCWVGAYYAINPEGDVSPCPMFLDHVNAGNVIDTPLADILYKSELFLKITDRKNLEGKCGNCKYTYTCGGCRVMAYYYTGNPFAEDPTCFINELSEKELNKKEKQTIKTFKNYLRMAKFGKIYNDKNSL